MRMILIKGLDRSCYEQQILCTQAKGGLPARISEEGCLIHEIGVFNGIADFEPYSNALRVVRAFKPDIIHGAVYEGVLIAVFAGLLGRVPVIIGEETSDPQDRRFKGHLLYRLLAGMTHRMVAVSPAVQHYLVDVLRIPENKVTMINNAVSEEVSTEFSEVSAIRELFGIGSDDFVVGTVSRLFDNHKRVSDLIQALAIVKDRCPGVHLLIVGDGPDREMLQALAIELGVAHRTHFAGYQVNTWPYYSVMNLFALASAREAFGLVLVEAMLAGLPVIATRVGGIPDVVLEQVTGVLVEPGRPQAIADAIITLRRDSGLRTTMGQNGRQRAIVEFSADRYLHEIDHLYQGLVKSRGVR
jgi:glycosyltransferase involved in cell wall biosynthesis